MVCNIRTLLALAALPVAAAWITGCEADDSAPTRGGSGGILAPDAKSRDSAEKRELEQPKREMPSTAGPDTPGHSDARPAGQVNDGKQVVTLAADGAGAGGTSNLGTQSHGFVGPSGWNAIGHTQGPNTVYDRNNTAGPIPPLPVNPGSVPMTGSAPLPTGDWSVDFSWGQGLVIQDYPHRPWAEVTATYQDGTVRHNPVYYYNIQEHLPVPQNSGTTNGDIISSFYEIPWFYLNTAALPVLMVLEPPLAQRTTAHESADPNFRGHLPETGAVVPVPAPGSLHWEYPFLNPDGTVKQPGLPAATEPTTVPAPTPTPPQ
jgi:hypothetical protein